MIAFVQLFCYVAGASGVTRHLREEQSLHKSYGSHGFFDPQQYDTTSNCYSEFMNGTKIDWSLCCENDELDSPNCQVYYPNDICYDYIDVGMVGVNAGHWFEYPNQQWDECCEQLSGIFDPDMSEYCRPLSEQLDSVWEQYKGWIILGIVVTITLVVALISALTCCCCGCRCLCRKAAKQTVDVRLESPVPRVIETHPEPMNIYASPRTLKADHATEPLGLTPIFAPSGQAELQAPAYVEVQHNIHAETDYICRIEISSDEEEDSDLQKLNFDKK